MTINQYDDLKEKINQLKNKNVKYKIIEMQIQSTLLKVQIRNLQKQNAFLKLKIHHLQQDKTPSQITIINKQLYLDYMEEVLSYKQKQLLQTQNKLQSKAIQLMNQQAKSKLINPLQNSTQIDIFLKKIQQIKNLLINQHDQNTSFELHQWKQFFKKQKLIIQECRNYQKQTQVLIKNQYQNLVRQRKQFAESMDKFQQLHSYEKYLNQLQKVLQLKQNQVLQKQDQVYQIKKSQGLQINHGSLTFGRQTHSMKQPQQKRRLKIFQSAHKSQCPRNFQQYQSDRSSGSHFSHYVNQTGSSQKDQSSFIMQESQTNQNQSVKKCLKCQNQQNKLSQQKQTTNIQIQTQIQTSSQCLSRLQKEKKILKFGKLWLRYSIDSKKASSNNCKKTIGLYLWRLNTIFDPQIPHHMKQTFQWPLKYQESLKEQQIFPYVQLSLNRRKYCQLTLDWQRKILHQKKIKNSLKNIIKNKNARQRIIFICYFKKYLQNSKLRGIQQLQKALLNGNKMSGKETTIVDPNSRYHTESNLISVNSSRIMNQHRPNFQNTRQTSKQNKKSKGNLNPKSMSSTNLLTFSYNKFVRGSKQNLSPSQSLDTRKLKEYIRVHEQAQKSLATQCVKTQAICKLGQILCGCYNKSIISGFYSIKTHQQNERMIDLQKRINKYEFKWQLFMTKCKLALVNNNNKISHLQETLAFMFSK